MTIPIQMSLHGFIAAAPQINFTSKGTARFYARVGVEHYRKETDGSFTKLEPTFHDLVAYAKMDNLRLFSRRHALRKAYTSAIVGMDSGAHAQRLHSQGRSISELGDPNLTHGQGGLVIMKDGVILGGIGVGGYPSGQRDEDLSRVGLQAMNL